jgi:hypothetical protein
MVTVAWLFQVSGSCTQSIYEGPYIVYQERHKASSGKGLIIILIPLGNTAAILALTLTFNKVFHTKRVVFPNSSSLALREDQEIDMVPVCASSVDFISSLSSYPANTHAYREILGPVMRYVPRPIPISRSRKVSVLESSHCQRRRGLLAVASAQRYSVTG